MTRTLTRRGFSLSGGAAGLAVAARIVGVEELAIASAAAFLLVVVALVLARRGSDLVAAQRMLHPSRVHAGTPARVDLALVNHGDHRTPLLALSDGFDRGRRHAEFLVAPLDAGETARAAYRVPTTRRGIYTVGPLTVARTDPFGVTRSTRRVAGTVELTVYPRVDPIVSLPQALGLDPMAGASRATRSPSGEDFFTLRPYVQGDDLRRVHWKSTARTDELMIRQNEMPWQTRTTVVLDTRTRAHAGESFERCVEAAASIVTVLASRQTLLRFLTTSGFELGFGEGHQRYEHVMEHLATVAVEHKDNYTPLMARLRREGTGGALVVVAAGASLDELQMLGRLGARYRGVVLVHVKPSAYADTSGAASASMERREASGPDPIPRVLTVPVTLSMGFAQAWNEAMGQWRRSVTARS